MAINEENGGGGRNHFHGHRGHLGDSKTAKQSQISAVLNENTKGMREEV